MFNKNYQYAMAAQPYQQNNSSKKKNITIIVGILVLIVAIAVVVLVITNVSKTQEYNKRISQVRRIGNYILFGEDKDQAISDPYDNTKGYKIEGVSYSSVFAETKEEYEQKIADVDAYYNQLSKIIDEVQVSDSEEDLKLAEYLENLRAYIILQKTNYLDERYIVAYFKHEGYIDTLNYIDEFYGALLNSDNEIIKNIGDLETRSLKVAVDEYRAYEQVGCVSGYVITGCDREVKVNERNESFKELNNLKNIKISGIKEQAIKGYWSIYE